MLRCGKALCVNGSSRCLCRQILDQLRNFHAARSIPHFCNRNGRCENSIPHPHEIQIVPALNTTYLPDLLYFTAGREDFVRTPMS
jgi:hypothetical protein